MFYDKQEEKLKNKYVQLLSMMGSLSNLFSTSTVPYLDSRIAENVFCRALEADNISRQDCTADAKKNNIGIGIKTWVEQSKLQKIAEFNKDRAEYIKLKDEDLIYKIAYLRNERIELTKRTHDLDELIYHCITRKDGKFIINESKMDKIDINTLQIISRNNTRIKFKDKFNEYSFNFSKSVLMKRFQHMEVIRTINIDIIEEPYIMLENCISNNTLNKIIIDNNTTNNYIILPLYSYNRKTKDKEVPLKSGLNQWNAGGRERNINEIYIPISKRDHKLTPNFFPNRDIEFKLILPNKKELQAKICQDDEKALMSNPNKALGEWLLRDVLNLEEGHIITYDMLEDLGIDSVRIVKLDELKYEISFAKVGTYEEFVESKIK